MKIHHPTPGAIKAELQMTSLIDVVFLLLIFFITTFQFGSQESEFRFRMPKASSEVKPTTTAQPIRLRLKANAEGELAEILLDDLSFGVNFDLLRVHLMERISPTTVPEPSDLQISSDAWSIDGPEVEIDLDYQLRYTAVADAISAVSGQKRGGQRIRLFDKIKFAPVRPKP